MVLQDLLLWAAVEHAGATWRCLWVSKAASEWLLHVFGLVTSNHTFSSDEYNFSGPSVDLGTGAEHHNHYVCLK